jgi:hypothetical protein
VQISSDIRCDVVYIRCKKINCHLIFLFFTYLPSHSIAVKSPPKMKQDHPMHTISILRNNALVPAPDKVRSVLILFEETATLIGDAVLKFDQFKTCRSFFPHATIAINFAEGGHLYLYKALLQNSPYLDEITHSAWRDLLFETYDIIICVTANETGLLHYLDERYQSLLESGTMTTAVFSMSAVMLNQPDKSTMAFPVHHELLDYAVAFPGPPFPELFIQEEEKIWAENWLAENGVQRDEHLFIFIDSSSKREKLIKTEVFASLLSFLLKINHTRILIYDEKGIGKDLFYQELLGRQAAARIVFAKSLGLRKDLCLLASARTRMIIGPCTGLLHCASGIYNNFTRNGMKTANVPVLITYTGKYGRPFENAQLWWGKAPLVHCLQLRNINGQPVLQSLHEQEEDNKTITHNLLHCQDYTAAQLTGFISKKLVEKQLQRKAASATV